MYTGTLIEDLIKTVQHTETTTVVNTAAKRKPPVPMVKRGGMLELRAFMIKMQQVQRVRAGVA